MREIGHGNSSDMTPHEALARAASCEPTAIGGVAADDPQGLEAGLAVVIRPDVDGGEQPVDGLVRYADAATIVIDRTQEGIGNVCVHFPRAGYRVEPA